MKNLMYQTINCRGKLIDLSQPKVMGILNITPDSFYKNSRVESEREAIDRVQNMLKDGATFIDLGAMSSRPNAEIITQEEEQQRLLPLFRYLRKEFPETLFSIDTIHAKTAQKSIDAGADLINDISGGNYDGQMREVVAKGKVPFIAMHMRGTPKDMQEQATYDDLLIELMDECISLIHRCEQAGITDILLDPGFGFSKTREQNFALLHRMNELNVLGKPMMAGVSRKSMIYKTLDVSAEEALNGTTALHMVCLQNGASILRVHDVKEAVECVKLFEELANS